MKISVVCSKQQLSDFGRGTENCKWLQILPLFAEPTNSDWHSDCKYDDAFVLLVAARRLCGSL
jgi:hypothetical protein